MNTIITDNSNAEHAISSKFDSWFAFPKTIVSVVKRKLDVICMLKISSKIHYLYQGEWMNLKEIYKRITPTAKGDIIGSVIASIRESKKNPDLVEVKIVFVKDRHSKNWLAVLSTNTAISEEIAHQIMDAFILALPVVWKQKLKLSA